MEKAPVAGGIARRKPSFHPQWGDHSPYTKFATNYVHKHLWRVIHDCPTFEDGMQEAACVFAKCVDHYITNPRNGEYGNVDNPKWFMAIYSRALSNRWFYMTRHDVTADSEEEREAIIARWPHLARLANKAVREDAIPIGEGEGTIDPEAEPTFAQALACASDELRDVFSILITAPEATLQAILSDLRDPDERWNLNTRLRRMAKIPLGVDLVRELRELFC